MLTCFQTHMLVSKLFEKILYIKKSFAKLAKAHQIKWQIKIIKFYILHPDLPLIIFERSLCSMLNMVLQLDNDCEGLFYISLKYRRDKDIIYTLYVFISIYSFYTLN